MNRALAFAHPFAAAAGRVDALDLARSLIVHGSAVALILAGHVLPF